MCSKSDFMRMLTGVVVCRAYFKLEGATYKK